MAAPIPETLIYRWGFQPDPDFSFSFRAMDAYSPYVGFAVLAIGCWLGDRIGFVSGAAVVCGTAMWSAASLVGIYLFGWPSWGLSGLQGTALAWGVKYGFRLTAKRHYGVDGRRGDP
ncbi:MAG: hypothetical protein OXI90_04575 [Gammaproteobacteria bacterium]|nr:hypothetical protein [Gammaproteobacteria bacterium]